MAVAHQYTSKADKSCPAVGDVNCSRCDLSCIACQAGSDNASTALGSSSPPKVTWHPIAPMIGSACMKPA